MDAAIPARGTTELATLLSAMDVIDKERSNTALIDDELTRGQRRQKILAKLRTTYADQGIAVPDQVLETALDTLEARRFAYTAPPSSIATRLARLYVTRNRWAAPLRRYAFGTLAAVLVFGFVAVGVKGIWHGVQQTQVHRFDADMHAYQGRVQQAESSKAELDRLRPPEAVAPAISHLQRVAADTRQQFRAATAAVSMPTPEDHASVWATVEKANSLPQSSALQARMQDLLRQARGWVQRAPAIATARRVGYQIPVPYRAGADRIAQGLSEAVQAADAEAAGRWVAAANTFGPAVADLRALVVPANLDTDTRGRVQALQDQVTRDLASGDGTAAAKSILTLQDTLHAIATPATLRIVSRPGERSGVWRHPNDNRSSRAYYLVIEAVDPSGHPLLLPVTSEETQKTTLASTFGIRVLQDVYDKVASEKQRTGRIVHTEVGEKRSGTLNVKYAIAATGGTITEW